MWDPHWFNQIKEWVLEIVENSVLSTPLSYEYVFKCCVFFYILAFVYGIYFCIVRKLWLGGATRYPPLTTTTWHYKDEAGVFWRYCCRSGSRRVSKNNPGLTFFSLFRVNALHPASRQPFEPPLQPSHLAARAWAAMGYSLFRYSSFRADCYPILTT